MRNRLEYRPNIKHDPEYIALETVPIPEFTSDQHKSEEWLDKLDEAAKKTINIREILMNNLAKKELPITPEIEELMDELGISSLTYENYAKLADEKTTFDTTDETEAIDNASNLPTLQKAIALGKVFNFDKKKSRILDYADNTAINSNDRGLSMWPAAIIGQNLSRELTTLQNLAGFYHCGKSHLLGEAEGILNGITGAINEVLDAADTNERATLNLDAGLKIDPKTCEIEFFTKLGLDDFDILKVIYDNGLKITNGDILKFSDQLKQIHEKFKSFGFGKAFGKIKNISINSTIFKKAADSALRYASSQAKQFVGETLEAAKKASRLVESTSTCPPLVKSLMSAIAQGKAVINKMDDLAAIEYRAARGLNMISQKIQEKLSIKNELASVVGLLSRLKNGLQFNPEQNLNLTLDILGMKAKYPFSPRSFDSINPFKRPNCL